MSTGDWIQIAILITYAAVGIASIIFSRKSIKKSIALTKEQIKAQMFVECTRRYNEIIFNMPNDSHGSTESPEIQKYMALYFNLCSEEYYLWDKGMIDPIVWDMWKDGMQITMTNERYKTAWKLLSGSYNRNFWTFFQYDVIEWKKHIAKSGDTEAAK